jgi:hypothetical protein
MNPRSPSSEASLLYATPCTIDFEQLRASFADLAQAYGVRIEAVDQPDDDFILISCDVVQVLVATDFGAPHVARYLEAVRPRAAQVTETEILARLSQNVASASVLVLDATDNDAPTGAAHEALKSGLCWELTEVLLAATTPTLIYWGETDTLYAAEEFLRANIYLVAQSERSAETCDITRRTAALPPHFLGEPVLPTQAQEWIDQPHIASAETAKGASVATLIDKPRFAPVDFLLAMALPNRAALRLDRMQQGMDSRRAIMGASIGCALVTVSITGLPWIHFLGL